MNRADDVDNLRYYLQLLEKEKSIESNSRIAAFISHALRSVDIRGIQENDRNFVLAKHLMHYILLDNFVEGEGLSPVNPIPNNIMSTTLEPTYYIATGYNYRIALINYREPGSYSFILNNLKTGGTSKQIKITDDDICQFQLDTALSTVRKSEIIFRITTVILTFLRGKQPGSSISLTPVENPDAPVEYKSFLYRFNV